MKNEVMPPRVAGVYMDHSTARILEPLANSVIVKVVESEFTHAEMEFARSKSEHLMHEKEQQLTQQYYQHIAEELVAYGHVLLFGPTEAKDEFYNFLRKDDKFSAVKIHVKSSDKLPENQQESFVRDYFAKNA